mmetsp:Transcript_1808/g.1993  ORF Transcript_1808/g.1993 Transcript_1808/m.1993 type:complete len:516 (-) Transcript_1808:854-2401(-)
MGSCVSTEPPTPESTQQKSAPPKSMAGNEEKKPSGGEKSKGGGPKLLHYGSVLKRDVQDLNSVYSLGKELGRGQFGVTYLASDKKTGQKYACKCISKRKLLTKEDAEDVEREVAIMYHLQGQEAIVQLKDAYEDRHTVQLVMELCEGGELFDAIVARGHYNEKQAAAAFRTIIKVVAQCHALGVMHRDLKPENFLLSKKDPDSELKATDFGLSMFINPSKKFTDVVGSAYYVAPEVLKRSYGPEADVWSAGVILYILLCGIPPFWAETEAGIFKAVMVGKYDMTSDPWPSISSSAKDVVRALLKQDPKERMTAAQALDHPWVKGDTATESKLDDSVVTRLKKFAQMNKFKKLALEVIASQLSTAEIKGLEQMFKAIDTDNSGSITLEELRKGLTNLNGQVKEDELVKIMEACDVDGNGSLSYEEFIAATMHLNKLESAENMMKAFAYFDKDNSGYITKEELRDVMKDLETSEIDQMIEQCDLDHDGRIDYEEFCYMMRSRSTAPSHNARKSLRKR